MDNNQNTNQQTGNEKTSIEINNHSKFVPLLDSRYIDSTQFCEEISNVLFSSIFKDFYGSRVEIAPNHMIGLSIFFREQTEAPDDTRPNGIERTVTQESMRDMDARIRNYNNSLRQNSTYKNQFRLTKEAKDLLDDLIPAFYKNNGKVDWGRASEEENNRSLMNNNQQTCIKVHLDIHKVVKVFYGAKDDQTGEPYQYMVSLGNPINPIYTQGGGFMTSQWQLFIHRLKTKETEKLARMYGMSSQNNLGIITQTK